jgi:hypothetical protein
MKASLTPPNTPASLQALRELPLPAPVSYAPQTVGWLVVLILLAALALTFAWIARRRYERERYRREALDALAAIEAKFERDDMSALADIAPLMKRTALAIAPREHVASLSGASWLKYLKQTYHAFDTGSAALLYTASYAPREHLDAITREQASRLLKAARDWIEHHHVEV